MVLLQHLLDQHLSFLAAASRADLFEPTRAHVAHEPAPRLWGTRRDTYLTKNAEERATPAGARMEPTQVPCQFAVDHLTTRYPMMTADDVQHHFTLVGCCCSKISLRTIL